MISNDTGLYEAGPTGQRSADGGTNELKALVSSALRQIAEAEQRNNALLREMHQRVEALGQDARATRSHVPSAYLPGFERIEDGMALLASRIAETAQSQPTHFDAPPESAPNDDPFAIDGLLSSAAPVPQSIYVPRFAPDAGPAPSAAEPQPLRSGSGSGSGQRRRLNGNYPADVDPFDVVESLPGNPSEPWSPEGAVALSEFYASGEGTFGPKSDDVAGEATGPSPLRHSEPAAIASSAEAKQSLAQGGGFDSVWLDGRLNDLAMRLERRLPQGPEPAIVEFGQRLEVLERRIADAMSAERYAPAGADPVALQHIENQVQALAVEFEAARGELRRIQVIEEQLATLLSNFNDDQLAAVVGQAVRSHLPLAGGRDANELQTVAMIAAEAAVARLAQGGHGFAALDATAGEMAIRVDDLHSLLAGYVDERRIGDEHNAQAMDALQQAMLRVLDRLDSLEDTAPPRSETAYFDAGDYRPAADTAEAHQPIVHAADAPAPGPVDIVPEPATKFVRDAVDRDEATTEQALPDDPIARQRALLQASAQRAAMAQREKQKTEVKASPTGIAARLVGVITRKSPAKSGSGKLMVSGMAVAAALGFGAMLVLSGGYAPDTPATAAAIAEVAPGANAAAEQNKTVSALPAPARAEAVQGGAAARATPVSADADAPQVEAQAYDADPSGATEAPSEERMPARLASAAGTQSPISGLVFQSNADTSLFDAPPSQGPGLPINGSGSALPGDVAANSAGTSAVELPPATVGPLSMRLAAAKGDPSAEFEVASRLAEGKGTDQNLKEAARWYQRAAAQGFVQAQYRLATLYERGLGVKADLARAKSWYQRAAEQGNVKSMHNLAVLAAGRSGGAPDYASAAVWFTQAANHGLADSQYNLGVLTESGLGVEKDRVQAAMWFILAAQGGDKEAIRRRDQMKSKLDKGEWSAADHLARSWQPMAPDKLANDNRYAGEVWKSRQAQAPAE